MKRYFLMLAAATILQIGNAQQASDAIRYSYLNQGGTARFIGGGGAFTALGADFTSASTNPAGIAMFRGSEFSLTPGLRFANAQTSIRGSQDVSEDSKSNLNFNSLGLVFATEPHGSRWQTFNFAIGLNKLANFHNAIYYEGKHAGSLMNNYFADFSATANAGGSTDDLDPFGTRLAYDAGAFYENPDSVVGGWTYDFAGAETAKIKHAQSILQTGGMNEMTMAFAGNYEDKLSVGVTIGVPFVNYKLEATYDESDPDAQVEYFDKLTRTEFLRTNGIGVNFKMGVIYKASQALRFGASFHTPTFLSLTDNYENTFSYSYTDGSGSNSSGEKVSPNGTFDYKLRTPWRASFGAAAVFLKNSYVSADIEMVDYSANRFNLTTTSSNTANQALERELNSDIRRDYGRATNVRLGAQLRKDKFLVRGGFNLLGKYQEGESGFNTAYSAGVGIREERYFVELGYRRSSGTGSLSPYFDPELADNEQLVADAKTVANDFVLTVGFKF